MMWQDEANEPGIKISEIHFEPIRPREGLVGFVRFTINGHFSVGGVGVHTRPHLTGVRLLYPTKQLHTGASLSLFHPISKEAGKAVERAVWEKIKSLYQDGGVDALP